MKNIEVKQDGDILTLVIDTSKRFEKSASGKNTIVASTQGNVTLDNGITLGVNVYTK